MKPSIRKGKDSKANPPAAKRSGSRRQRSVGQTKKPRDRQQPKIRQPKGGTATSVPIVGIGASAGGLEAFTRLLKHLPLDTGLGFVLVQHLDPQHDSALTQLLARATSMPVREAANNLRVKANHVYVIPPNTNLSITQGRLKLQPRPQPGRAQRAIDVFFESLAQDQRERAIGVILSGTASDGTLGLEAIKAEGGITFAQDDSAKYDSMPRSAIAAGCVDFVLSPEHIAKELARIATHPYVAGQATESHTPEDDRASATAHVDDEQALPSGGQGTPRTGATQAHAEAEYSQGVKGAANGFKKILLLLRTHSGVDFSLYKSTTIQRRIARRLLLNKYPTLESYIDFLRGNAKELDALYSDVLISVTSFFRNPDAFDVLTRTVFPKLLRQRGDEPVRVWVLGCSTGQEAYSIAMTFVECAEKASRTRSLQVFATDLNDALLNKARHGLYAKSLAQDLSLERVRRFFVEEEGGYRIIKPLREMVVFARQNLISDPPFSRMDLISCRNLLIYLEPDLQKKAFPTFHYALKPEGFLLLGASESIGGFTELFEPVDKKHKIYSKKVAPTPAFHLPVKRERDERSPSSFRPPFLHSMERGKGGRRKATGELDASNEFRGELNAQREADRVMVKQFAPPGVLINADLQIVQFRGPTGAYLEPPSGKASFDVLKMARQGLMLPLRAAINKAKKDNAIARKDHVRVQQNGKARTVNVKVIPLKSVRERSFLIVFEDANRDRAQAEPSSGAVRATGSLAAKEVARRIADLETDLAETRDYLQSIQEQHEAANEELQASNEEVQSANEELQSVNEELETSKEELESANEELTTVNEEMANRNAELTRLNSDLVNLQTSIKLAIVLLGRDLTIRRFSAQAATIFNLQASDVGRPIGNVRHNLRFEGEGRQPSPASTVRSQGDTEPSRAGWQVKRPEDLASEAVEVPPDLDRLIADVIATVREHECMVQDRENRWYHLRVRPYFALDNKVDGAVLVLLDITDLKRNELAIAAAREYAETIIETVRDPLLVLDDRFRVESANQAFYHAFRVSPAETIGRVIFALGDHQWDVPRLRTLLEDILPRNNSLEDFLVEHIFEQLGRRSMLLNARRMHDPAGMTRRILLVIEDITERKQAEASLQQSEGLFSTVVDQAPNGMYVVDAQFRVQQINSRALPVFSAVHPLIGRDFSEVIEILWGPEVGGQVSRIFRHTLETGERYMSSGFSERRHDLGVEQSYEWETQRVTLPTGEHGVVCYFTDITERKNAEEKLRVSEERFRSLVSVITDVSWVTDAAGAFIAPQPEWEAYTGQSWEVHRGFGWADALHADDRERVKTVWLRACETHTLYESRGRLWHAPTQEWRHYIARAAPLFHADGSVREWVGTCTDIEDLNRTEAALRRLNEESEARVEDRTRELVASQERLRSLAADLNLAEQRERQRLAAELHDYLAQLLVLCKIKLAQVKSQPLAPPLTKALDDVQEVMDQALTYTRTLVAQLSPPILNEFGLPTALKWLAEQMLQRDLIVSLELESETLPLPEEQSVLLFQSIRELLMNIVKHAGTKQAKVAVTQAEGILHITVSDQGAGFDLAAAGTGSVPSFGLFSIRERMLVIGGRFELISQPGEGTQATLLVPLASQKANVELGMIDDEMDADGIDRQKPSLNEQQVSDFKPAHTQSSLQNSAFPSQGDHSPGMIHPSSFPQPVRVLVVDDHAMVRQGLRSILDAYQDISVVGEAADGEEAVEMSRALSPDVIIMDVNMPKMDGVEATSRIKAHQPGTRIIGLSLSQSSQVEPLLLEAGASAYVSKEAAVDRLYEAIIMVMKRKTE